MILKMNKTNKKFYLLVFAVLFLSCFLFLQCNLVKGEEIQQEEVQGEDIQEEETQREDVQGEETQGKDVQEEYIPTIFSRLLLYKNETYNFEINKSGRNSFVSLESSDPSVVSVSNKGRIKALKCGASLITITLKKGEVTSMAKVRVRVVYSSFCQTSEYSSQIQNDGKNNKKPLLTLHTVLKTKEEKQIELEGIASTAAITYSSSAPQTASVNKNGLITARAQGKAKIIIKIKQNHITYTFYDVIHVTDEVEKPLIEDEIRNKYFGKSAFIGSSLAEGQRIYFNYMGSSFLGGPVVLAKVSYSFTNEASSSYRYKVTYKGKAYKVRDAVAASGAKRIFINMGINDLWKPSDKVFEEYKAYIGEIKKKNPDVIIFIEATTPIYRGRERGYLSNKWVDKLNSYMEDYCNLKKDMYYIDVNSVLKDKSGYLNPSYCSDHYVHLNIEGYRVWTNEVCKYVDKLLIKEMQAEDAVKTVSESRIKGDYKTAKELVGRLKSSTVKQKLLEKLKKIKSRGLKPVSYKKIFEREGI